MAKWGFEPGSSPSLYPLHYTEVAVPLKTMLLDVSMKLCMPPAEVTDTSVSGLVNPFQSIVWIADEPTKGVNLLEK